MRETEVEYVILSWQLQLFIVDEKQCFYYY